MDKYIVSVGAGINQLSFLNKAVNKGFKIISFDRDTNAIGKKLCYVSTSLSTWDAKGSIKWLKSLDIHFSAVGCFSCSYAVVTQQNIANYFNLPAKMETDLVNLTQNKKQFNDTLNRNQKALFQDLNEYKLIKFLMTQKNDKKFIVKSSDGIASNNIKQYTSIELINNLKRNEIDLKNYIIEPYINGREFRGILFIQNAEIKIFNVIEKQNLLNSFFTTRFLPVSNQEILIKIKKEIQNIIQKFNLNDCLLKIDLIMFKGNLYILEVDFEIAGDYFEVISPYFYNYDYLNYYLKFILGKKIESITHQTVSNTICADYLYNISHIPFKVDHIKTKKILNRLLGKYIYYPTKESNSTVKYPKSNLDNFALIIHQRRDLTNNTLNNAVNMAIINNEF